jgi:hypothetical protein
MLFGTLRMFKKFLTILFVGISLFAPSSDQKSVRKDGKEISDYHSNTSEGPHTMVNTTTSAPQLFLSRLEK